MRISSGFLTNFSWSTNCRNRASCSGVAAHIVRTNARFFAAGSFCAISHPIFQAYMRFSCTVTISVAFDFCAELKVFSPAKRSLTCRR